MDKNCGELMKNQTIDTFEYSLPLYSITFFINFKCVPSIYRFNIQFMVIRFRIGDGNRQRYTTIIVNNKSCNYCRGH